MSETGVIATVAVFALLTCVAIGLSVWVLVRYNNDSTSTPTSAPDNMFDNLTDGSVPVYKDGKFVDSYMSQPSNTDKIVTTKRMDVGEESVSLGPIALRNGGSQLTVSVAGAVTDSYLVMSDLNGGGSSEAYQWKFGPVIESPPDVPPTFAQSSIAGLMTIQSPTIISGMYTAWTYNVLTGSPDVNLTVYLNEERETPIYDYKTASGGGLISLEPGFTVVELISPIFFKANNTLYIELRSESQTDFALLGDSFGGFQFVPSVATTLRIADRITFTDTETTINSALTQFDIYVKSGATGKTGTALDPFGSVQEALDFASGNETILLDGVFVITEPITFDKSITLVGTQGDKATITYPAFSQTNGSVFLCDDAGTIIVSLSNLNISNGVYGFHGTHIGYLSIENVNFINCGWNGVGLNLNLPASPGTLGFNSTQAELEAYGNSENVSKTGRAVYLEDCNAVNITACSFVDCYVGAEIRNCPSSDFVGIPGAGVILSEISVIGALRTGVICSGTEGDIGTGCNDVIISRSVFSSIGGSAIVMHYGYECTVANHNIRNIWGPAVVSMSSSNLKSYNINANNTNRGVHSSIGEVLPLGAYNISGTIIRDYAIFSNSLQNSSFFQSGFDRRSGYSSHVRYGFVIDDLGLTDEIDKTGVNLNTTVFDGFDHNVYLMTNALTDLSDKRTVRLSINTTTYSNTILSDVVNDDNSDYYELPFSVHTTTSDDLDVDLDPLAKTITLTPGNTYSYNQLHAYSEGTNITIIQKNTDKIQVDRVNPEKVTFNSVFPVDQSLTSVINQMNMLFIGTESSVLPPQVTSATAMSVQSGEVINYHLMATNLGGITWTALANGFTPSVGDPTILIGSTTTLGDNVCEATLTNSYGNTNFNLTITVVGGSNFTNSTSLYMEQKDNCLMSNIGTSFPMYRSSNGTGVSDAWSISVWVNFDSTNSTRTIMQYGKNTNNDASIRIQVISNDLRLHYGTGYNYLTLETDSNLLSNLTWYHIVVTYDGGTTGSSSSNMNNYYDRFTVYVNNVKYTEAGGGLIGGHNNYGYSGSFASDSSIVFGGTLNNTASMKGYIDEGSVYDSELSIANVNTLYNGGVAGVDLDTASVPAYSAWWRFGDGDNFPTITDQSGNSYDLTMFNMTPYAFQSSVSQ